MASVPEAHYFTPIEIYNWLASFLLAVAQSGGPTKRSINPQKRRGSSYEKSGNPLCYLCVRLLAKMQGYLCMWDKIIIFPR